MKRMILEETDLVDVLKITPEIYEDERGFFFESFNEKEFLSSVGTDLTFVQDNHSRSKKGVLRGLHYQIKHPQGKLVRVIRGSIFDVVEDLRKTSKTFGKHYHLELTERDKTQLWVPPGLAHGFLALSDFAEVAYKTTDYWSPENERTLVWNDPKLSIDWPLTKTLLSKKDSEGCLFSEAELFN